MLWLVRFLTRFSTELKPAILGVKERKTTDHKKGAGRPTGFQNPEVARKVRKSFQRMPNVSIGDLAKKIQCESVSDSHFTISNKEAVKRLTKLKKC